MWKCYLVTPLILAFLPFSTTTISGAESNVLIGQSVDKPTRYSDYLRTWTAYTEVVSGGYNHGNCVRLVMGDHTFYNDIPNSRGTAGLYVVAIFKNEILIHRQYNTYTTPGASEGLRHDLARLPPGTFVVVTAKDEPTRHFDQRGQQALQSIGAQVGLLNQEYRTSYFCMGIKGMAKGDAIEQVGKKKLKHVGLRVGEPIEIRFPKQYKPYISKRPGRHERLWIGDTEVLYYIPEPFNPKTAQYLIGIHGAGAWHRPGASNRIAQFRDVADRKNLVVIAPSFDPIFNWKVNRGRDFDEQGLYKNPKIVKDWHLSDFSFLLNKHNKLRTDLKLLEIFEAFNQTLMRRKKFILYGHSGGGQFVSRFITFYPERIEKAAISSAGSLLFPAKDKNYPYGLRMGHFEERFGDHVQAEDLTLTPEQMDRKLNALLNLEVHLIAGENDNVPDGRIERSWQGAHRLERHQNYLNIMRQEDRRLKELGIRPQYARFQFKLHIMSGVGHNSAAGAKKAVEVLFEK